MDLAEKLEILADSAKYDVACTSSGVDRPGRHGALGSSAAAGICYAFTADGRCVSLLKVLYSNVCSYDCSYCVNRRSNDRPRATFTPCELAELTIGFYRRNYIEGLFLSSAVLGTPDRTMELMIEALRILREEYHFNGYIHAKTIPGADPMLVEKIADWENALPPYLHLAYLPAPGVVRLRLSAYEVEGESVSHEIDRQFAALQRIIPRYVLGFERATMQEIVHNLLTQRRQTLATAESCTGGSIAARFTAMPGASAYFLCGVVAYSNESKNNLLGVDPETIASRGAVSEEVARQMAEGARRITGADYAVATTGIAGPAGGTEQKPVGTVWMAVAGPHRTVTLLKQCGTDRGQVIDRASAFALALLRDEIERDAAGE